MVNGIYGANRTELDNGKKRRLKCVVPGNYNGKKP